MMKNLYFLVCLVELCGLSQYLYLSVKFSHGSDVNFVFCKACCFSICS